MSRFKCCDLQKQLNAGAYGPNLADVEKQIAAHNIVHQSIEAYGAQLQPSTTTSQVATSTHAPCRTACRMSHLSSFCLFTGAVRRPQEEI